MTGLGFTMKDAKAGEATPPSKKVSVIALTTGAAMSSALGSGLVLGLKHALDPDHIVAVSTIDRLDWMLIMSSMIGLPFVWTARRFVRPHTAIKVIAGAFSIVFGLFLAYDIGFRQALFLGLFNLNSRTPVQGSLTPC